MYSPLGTMILLKVLIFMPVILIEYKHVNISIHLYHPYALYNFSALSFDALALQVKGFILVRSTMIYAAQYS